MNKIETGSAPINIRDIFCGNEETSRQVLSLLEELFRKHTQNPKPTVVFVAGASLTGKSTLRRELDRFLQDENRTMMIHFPYYLEESKGRFTQRDKEQLNKLINYIREYNLFFPITPAGDFSIHVPEHLQILIEEIITPLLTALPQALILVEVNTSGLASPFFIEPPDTIDRLNELVKTISELNLEDVDTHLFYLPFRREQLAEGLVRHRRHRTFSVEKAKRDIKSWFGKDYFGEVWQVLEPFYRGGSLEDEQACINEILQVLSQMETSLFT